MTQRQNPLNLRKRPLVGAGGTDRDGDVSKLGGGITPNVLQSHYNNDEIVTSRGELPVISVVHRYGIAMEAKSCC